MFVIFVKMLFIKIKLNPYDLLNIIYSHKKPICQSHSHVFSITEQHIKFHHIIIATY